MPDYPDNNGFGPQASIILPPLGLEYLAANIEDIADVCILDERLKDTNLKSIENKIDTFKPDYVGISSNYSFQIYKALKIAKIAKEHGSQTILGGWHPTLAFSETLNSEFVDIVVRGEGENTLRELIKNNSPIGIKGLSYKNNGKQIHNPDRELMNLKNLKFPARHLRSKEAKRAYNFFGIPVESIETSRGCPFSCNFCCIHHFYKESYRQRRIQEIILELKLVDIKNRASIIYIVDDNFVVNKKFTLDLCDALIKYGINKYFMSQARVDMVVNHPVIFKKMADAGFIFLFLGLESFSDRTLIKLNKRIKFEEIKSAIKILHDLGYIIQGNVILAADLQDREQDLKSTIEIASTLDVDIPTFSLLTPFPGTKLMEQVIEEDLLLTRDWRKFNWTAPTIKYQHLSPDDLNIYLKKAYKEVGFHPKEGFKRLIQIRGLKFHIKRTINQAMFTGITMMIKTLAQELSNMFNKNSNKKLD
ncbi:MAG: B12-binding domain-containing radical SAM protein [Promethearchaeota archaeon]